MRNILWLRDVKKEDINIVGGKGAHLGEMYNAGFPVPEAFIITAQAFKEFMEKTKLKEKIYGFLKVDIEDTQQLDKISREIRESIEKAEIPKFLEKEIIDAYKDLSEEEPSSLFEPCFVAVRSSATTEDLEQASFAGQQETFLNVKGNDALIEAIKKCWASLFTARAIYYRARHGFSHENSFIAVIVQKMMNFDKSGVIFTINPLTNNEKEIIIEAVFGLGEGIVSGAIEPDHYVLDKETGKLLDSRIGIKNFAVVRSSEGKTIKKELFDEDKKKQVLLDYELRKAWEYAVKIEKYYHFPQDIEFGFEAGNFYVVQSRPVTTTKKEMKDSFRTEEVPLLLGLPASSGVASGRVRIIHSLQELSKVQQGDILVTKMTSPDMVVAMQKASAIVTDEGGVTCHAAIVSRELGIPCVVGTKKATRILKDGMIVTVDGSAGKIYSGYKQLEVPKEIISEEMRIAWEEMKKKRRKVDLKVNCDLPEIAERAAATNADGVGLVRIEFMIAEKGIHPVFYLQEKRLDDYKTLLVSGLEKIASAFKGKPVWVRTSDMRTDEYRNLKGADTEPKEDNPMLGWHGIRRSLEQEEILRAEFEAIKVLHDKGYNNVGVMLPFLISIEELKRAKVVMRKVGLEPCKDIEFGVMLETPAACLIIEDLCLEGISFVSFGTNDLTQLVLGVDRNNEKLASLYNEMHPAVLRLIEMVINTCKRYGVKTSICGQAASNPEMARWLIEKGIDSLSVNIDSVERIRSLL
ncbi:MAG: phosphoenolpyruvate synthase [Candidatus Pacearchaeota archaeon]|nr:phosphoenolpyruvate synthase [Candidatus Pacearchaeota archaeon]